MKKLQIKIPLLLPEVPDEKINVYKNSFNNLRIKKALRKYM